MGRLVIGTTVLASVLLLISSIASADLRMFQRKAGAPVTFFGRGGFSADGLGQNGPGGALQAEIPAGSTVELPSGTPASPLCPATQEYEETHQCVSVSSLQYKNAY